MILGQPTFPRTPQVQVTSQAPGSPKNAMDFDQIWSSKTLKLTKNNPGFDLTPKLPWLQAQFRSVAIMVNIDYSILSIIITPTQNRDFKVTTFIHTPGITLWLFNIAMEHHPVFFV